jgi:hypothetical protein
VFSANLAALTIDHGSGEKPAGPSLLISYHDNQHYNSVRDNSMPKPPPPVRTFVRIVETGETTAIEVGTTSALHGSEKTKSNDESKEQDDVSEDVPAVQIDAKQKVKKNSQCPCGSGLRYKKCCLAKEKHAVRVQNLRSGQQSDVGFDVDDPEEIQGGFRVLKI